MGINAPPRNRSSVADEKPAGEVDEDGLSRNAREDYERFSHDMAKARFMPINEWEHGYSLSESEQENITNFSQLVDRAIQLANISDPTLLMLEQEEQGILTNFYDMAVRDPGMESFFKLRYYEWRGAILLTKAKDGTERKHQAAIGTKYVPRGPMLGQELPAPPEEEDSIIDKLLHRDRKKQQKLGGM